VDDQLKETEEASPHRATVTQEASTVGDAETLRPARNGRTSPKLLRALLVGGIGIFLLTLLAAIVPATGLTQRSPDASPQLVWVVLIGSMLIAVISLGINFWLYYVRAMLLKDGPALVPEKWGVLLANLSFETAKSREDISESAQALLRASGKQDARLEGLLESFLTLQQAISNRDDEIKRLRKGYDGKVFKRFLLRFIKASIAINEIKDGAKNSDQFQNLSYVARLLENALEECAVTELKPELNTDYRKLGAEVADGPEIVITEDDTLNFKIAEIKTPAYVIEGEGGYEVLIPATVVIYKSRNQNEGE
jgi:hypothetical protein